MGYGKTVVMTDFSNEYGCAWYHLDETDDDLMIFCRYPGLCVHQGIPSCRLCPYVSQPVDGVHRGGAVGIYPGKILDLVPNNG